MNDTTDFLVDEIYGDRLLISTRADQRELKSNIRAAYAILHSFPDVYIIINTHTISFGHKNPEYTIDQKLGDRKGIMSEKGVTAGFKSAKKQGCKVVVIDLDEHIQATIKEWKTLNRARSGGGRCQCQRADAQRD